MARQASRETAAERTSRQAQAAGPPETDRKSAAAFALGLWLALGVLLLITFWAYAPVRHYGFITLDDQYFVTGRMKDGLTWANVRWAFSHVYNAFYYPLTLLSHMVDRTVFGDWAGGPHLVNVALHLANTLLLFLFFRRATKAPWRSFIVAALFALHPLHVESVAWVAERKDVLSTFFEILTLLVYLWYVAKPSARRYVPLFLCFTTALMCKSMVVTLPLLLLVLDYWPLRRLDLSGGARASLRRLGHLLWEKVPLLALVPIWAWLTVVAQAKEKALSGLPLDQRVFNAILSYGRYILRMFYPFGLVGYYPHPESDISRPAVLAMLLALLALMWIALKVGRRVKYVPAGWLWYMGTLVPVIGIVQVGAQSSADRYTYIPLVGLFVILVWGAADALPASWFRKPAAAACVLVPLFAALALMTRAQVATWASNESFYSNILAYYPKCPLALAQMGSALALKGRFEEAVAHFEAASRVTANLPYEYKVDWGIDLIRLNRYEEAAVRLREALTDEPASKDAHFQLAVALSWLQRDEEAIAEYRKAYESGFSGRAIVDMGDVYRKNGLCKEASKVYGFLHRDDPSFAAAAAGLAACAGLQKSAPSPHS